jgi:hypothetical protein
VIVFLYFDFLQKRTEKDIMGLIKTKETAQTINFFTQQDNLFFFEGLSQFA